MFHLLVVLAGLFNLADSRAVSQKQGIEGYVLRIYGNQMPSVNRKPAPPQGFSTTLYVYQATRLDQVTRQGSSAFYAIISTKLVKKIETGNDGYFKVSLPQGTYSLFTKKGNLFYANSFDSHNTIAPVEVRSGKMTRTDVRVDYDAVY